MEAMKMTNAIDSLLSAAGSLWDNAFARYAMILGAVGAVPFYFLSMVVAQLGS